MAMNLKNNLDDYALLKDCVNAFHNTTNLPCTISTDKGEVIEEYGYGCQSCCICTLANVSKNECIRSHIFAMTEASFRFGGKYIYIGPMGLTYFVSPIIDDVISKAKVTVGPFLMVDKEDYIEIDLKERLQLEESQVKNISQIIEKVPMVEPEKVQHLSTLLFMAVGFLNNVTDFYELIEDQKKVSMQEKISAHIENLKSQEEVPEYPFELENRLLDCVASADKEGAQRYLNEIFGYIFFSTGGALLEAKTRVYELLILISRTAIKSGADSKKCLMLTHDYLQIIPQIGSMDELCVWLSKIANKFIESVFFYLDAKHLNVIQKAIKYIYNHYEEKITLESISAMVYLSPTYFSKIFKEEMNITFVTFLNEVRIEQSKRLLRDERVKLIDIANMVGFEDQSYFTKVFKKVMNMTPLQYRKMHR